jgi:deferrochelatase/peroxidase EfeB
VAPLTADAASPDSGSGAEDVISPFGAHQAGVATPQQRYATFVAADLAAQDAALLRRFLADVSDTVVAIVHGEETPALTAVSGRRGDADGLRHGVVSLPPDGDDGSRTARLRSARNLP